MNIAVKNRWLDEVATDERIYLFDSLWLRMNDSVGGGTLELNGVFFLRNFFILESLKS